MKKISAYLLTMAMLGIPRIEANISRITSNSKLEKIVEAPVQKEVPDSVIYKKYVQDLKLPRYKLDTNRCAEYAIKAATKLFKKHYIPADACNMKYHNEIVSELKDSSEFKKLIKQEKIKPGMIVGFCNRRFVKENKLKDEKHKTRTYNHVAVYAGLNKNFEPEFMHQDGYKIKKSTMSQMYGEGYRPRIVLDSSN